MRESRQTGTALLTIEGRRPGKTNSVYNVTVEPSIRIHPALYVGSNNHFKAGDDQASLKALLDELASGWVESLDYAMEIAIAILEKA